MNVNTSKATRSDPNDSLAPSESTRLFHSFSWIERNPGPNWISLACVQQWLYTQRRKRNSVTLNADVARYQTDRLHKFVYQPSKDLLMRSFGILLRNTFHFSILQARHGVCSSWLDAHIPKLFLKPLLRPFATIMVPQRKQIKCFIVSLGKLNCAKNKRTARHSNTNVDVRSTEWTANDWERRNQNN